jgi:hypothetical protein
LIVIRPQLRKEMLRHIIALSILMMSLLAAGVPALACGEGVPAPDCCPNGSNSPCEHKRSQTPEATGLNLCCTAGNTVATNAAVAAPSREFRQHWDRADLPALFVVLTTLNSAYAEALSADELAFVSRPFSYSTLYLSTGRLRL